ncbi:MAG TPA: hypothetical protein VFA11_05575 [Acidimicrobiales bacterium]|nr:hypothetical protein [Acidimicrobiales bacterium]
MPIGPEDIERLLDPTYVEGLPTRSMEEIRAARIELQEAETAVSFQRRLVQGRLDLIHSERHRRQEGGDRDMRSLVEELPSILAEHSRTPGPGRLPRYVDPGEDASVLTDEVDAVADPRAMADLSVLSDEDLTALTEALSQLERVVSDRRHNLHLSLDAVHEEIVRRYQSGEASVDTLLK